MTRDQAAGEMSKNAPHGTAMRDHRIGMSEVAGQTIVVAGEAIHQKREITETEEDGREATLKIGIATEYGVHSRNWTGNAGVMARSERLSNQCIANYSCRP